ncbi:MAG TPA: NAD(P)/FAD-dependent oxidoreductase, partial [Polyangiaceae bacterium]
VDQFQTRLGPVLDADFRRAEVDMAFGSVMAAALESVTELPFLGRRKRVLAELNVQTVTLLKEINDETVKSLLGRVGAKMTRELNAEWPAAGIERVVLGKGDPEIEGPCVGTTDYPAIAARAKAMWDAEGDTLVRRQL